VSRVSRLDSVPLSGFDQPLSGFLASPSFVALFHATAVPEVLPSESSPHRNRAPLSRPLAPSRSATRFTNDTTRALSPPVSSTPTLTRSGLIPPTTMSSLSARRSTLPGHSGPKRRSTSAPPATPTSKPCSSCESVRTDPSCPAPMADPLLGSCLSRAFSSHASGLRTRPAPESPEHAPSPKLRRTAQRTVTPPASSETAPSRERSATTSSADPSPVWAGRTTSRWRPDYPALAARSVNSLPLDFAALEYVESGVSPRRSPSLLRFLASSTTS